MTDSKTPSSPAQEIGFTDEEVMEGLPLDALAEIEDEPFPPSPLEIEDEEFDPEGGEFEYFCIMPASDLRLRIGAAFDSLGRAQYILQRSTLSGEDLERYVAERDREFRRADRAIAALGLKAYDEKFGVPPVRMR